MGSSLKEKLSTRQSSSSFLVRFIFRQNCSWQGEVHWLDEDRKSNFRSALELIKLMLEAMEESESPQADYELRSWDKSALAYSEVSIQGYCLSSYEETD